MKTEILLNFKTKTMKKTLLLIVFVLTNITAFAQNEADIDPTFITGTGFNGTVNNIFIQSDGKILVSGSFTDYNNQYVGHLARLNNDGSLDISFHNNLITYWGGSHNLYEAGIKVDLGIIQQSDGKIVIGSNNLYRLNINGTVEFVSAGFQVRDLFQYANSNNQLLTSCDVSGSYTTKFRVVDPSWTLSSGFANIDNVVRTFWDYGGGYAFAIGGNFTFPKNYMMFTSETGNILNNNFNNTPTGINGEVRKLVRMTAGRFIVGGAFTTFKGSIKNRIAACNTSGIDASFNTGTGFNNTVNSIVKQSDGNIIVVGDFSTYNSNIRRAIVRLDGTFGNDDSSFNSGIGFQKYSFSTWNDGKTNTVTLQSDGKILVGGDFTHYNGTNRNNIVRLKGTTALLTNDFTKAKVTIYPNPIKDILNVSLSENTSIEGYEIYDLLGKKIISKNTTENQINVSELSNGVYLLKVITGEGVMTNKFIKE
jgi:hypothetical protein